MLKELETTDVLDPAGLTYGSGVLSVEAPRCEECGREMECLGTYGGVPVYGHELAMCDNSEHVEIGW